MRRISTLIVALALTATACAGQAGEPAGPGTSTGPSGSTPGVFGGELQSFAECDALLDYYISHAIDLVGPYGLPGQGGFYYGVPEMAVEDAAAQSAPAAGRAGGDGAADFTNNQVAGVDEADIVKTDGKRIFTFVDGTLRVALVTDDGVDLAGTIQLDWWPTNMLLFGNTLILIGENWGGGPVPLDAARETSIAPVSNSPMVRLAQVDVSDPDEPTVERNLYLDGSYVGARLVDGVARVAITSFPVGFDWAFPEGSGLRAERKATEANRKIVEESTLDNWLPYFVLTDGRGREIVDGNLLDCTNVMAPRQFAGLNTLSILTFDLGAGIDSWADSGVVADGRTMYANADNLYIATEPWQNWAILAEDDARDAAREHTTSIHMFDISDPGAPAYVASGDVPGFLLNQFSMDEYDGYLRVATTTAPQGWWWSDESESMVVTLARRAKRLVEVGRVDGLGEGERIFSVRFMKDTGYVVTFRQTDPLYVIDLSDQENPSVAGALKILGYSAYLHPVGDHMLLGLGQDATDTGRVQGTQLSLFDVSDPANPRRVDQITMDGGYSQAENNHLAFTYVDGLVLAPYESWQWIEREGTEKFDTGVIAARVDGSTLTLDGVLRAAGDGPVDGKEFDRIQPWRFTPMRTYVIDGRIYTVTNGGIAVHDTASLDRIEFERF